MAPIMIDLLFLINLSAPTFCITRSGNLLTANEDKNDKLSYQVKIPGMKYMSTLKCIIFTIFFFCYRDFCDVSCIVIGFKDFINCNDHIVL